MDREIVDAVDAVARAVWELNTLWGHHLSPADRLNNVEGYPFGADFGDLAFAVAEWADNVREAFGGK